MICHNIHGPITYFKISLLIIHNLTSQVLIQIKAHPFYKVQYQPNNNMGLQSMFIHSKNISNFAPLIETKLCGYVLVCFSTTLKSFTEFPHATWYGLQSFVALSRFSAWQPQNWNLPFQIFLLPRKITLASSKLDITT